MAEQKVLIVDDEADVRGLVRAVLEEDYRVFEAPGGVAAVQAIENGLPDAVWISICRTWMASSC